MHHSFQHWRRPGTIIIKDRRADIHFSVVEKPIFLEAAIRSDKSATVKSGETSIAAWLRRANDRIKNKKKD